MVVLMVEVSGEVERGQERLTALIEVLAIVGEIREHWREAELCRLKGE
jgi:hypothetical protein